jgi:hypothetical protein
MAIEDQVKLVIVRSGTPDIKNEIGPFPNREAAEPYYRRIISQPDVLQVTIEPATGESTDDESTDDDTTSCEE